VAGVWLTVTISSMAISAKVRKAAAHYRSQLFGTMRYTNPHLLYFMQQLAYF